MLDVLQDMTNVYKDKMLCRYGIHVGNISKKRVDSILWCGHAIFNKKPRKLKRSPLKCSIQHRTTGKDMEQPIEISFTGLLLVHALQTLDLAYYSIR